MRDSATIASELIASGLAPAQMALLMELVLSMSTGLSTGQGGENRALEKRRAWDRDRKQRRREAEREAKSASALSTGLPPSSTGHPVESTGLSGGHDEDCLMLEDKKEGLSVGKERKKGSRLLVGTRVSDENRAVAIECGCPPDRVDDLWAEFVDYWSDIPGLKGCKLSWTGTWRNRVKQIFGGSVEKRSYTRRADTSAGRATSRETDLVTRMGGAALQYLKNRNSAGQIRGVSPDTSTSEGIASEQDAMWADYQARIGAR